jgi:hypothetical protein
MESNCESMMEASVDFGTHQRGDGWVGIKPVDRWTVRRTRDGEAVLLTSAPGAELRAPRAKLHTGYSRLLRLTMECPRNRGTSTQLPRRFAPRMIETADERGDEGRNLRSSPRTGKPFTWRRKVVDAASQQEGDGCLAR